MKRENRIKQPRVYRTAVRAGTRKDQLELLYPHKTFVIVPELDGFGYIIAVVYRGEGDELIKFAYCS